MTIICYLCGEQRATKDLSGGIAICATCDKNHLPEKSGNKSTARKRLKLKREKEKKEEDEASLDDIVDLWEEDTWPYGTLPPLGP